MTAKLGLEMRAGPSVCMTAGRCREALLGPGEGMGHGDCECAEGWNGVRAQCCYMDEEV